MAYSNAPFSGRIKRRTNILPFSASITPSPPASPSRDLLIIYHPNPPPHHPNPLPHPVFSYSASVETGSRAYVSVSYDTAKSSSQAFPEIHQSTLTRIAVVRQGVSSQVCLRRASLCLCFYHRHGSRVFVAECRECRARRDLDQGGGGRVEAGT